MNWVVVLPYGYQLDTSIPIPYNNPDDHIDCPRAPFHFNSRRLETRLVDGFIQSIFYDPCLGPQVRTSATCCGVVLSGNITASSRL